MTATITVKWQHPGKGAPLEAQDGLLQVEPMQGWIAGDAIVNPTVEPYAVTGGTVAVEIPDDTARVWRFDHYPKRSRAFQEYVLIPPATGAVAYTALEKVDPETAKPTPEALANALETVAAGTITTGQVVDGELVLTTGAGENINAGHVVGPAGVDGLDGTPGNDGTPGPSAYDIAVTNGYTGTETEWLASLKGADAPTITDNGTTVTIGA